MNNFENLINAKINELTKQEKKVAYGLLENPDFILDNNITDLSIKIHTSRNAITRFCKKIGFNGFTEFQYEFRKEYSQNISFHLDSESDMKTILAIEETYKNTISQMHNNQIMQDIKYLVEVINQVKKDNATLHIIASGYTLYIAKRMQYILRHHMIDSRVFDTYEVEQSLDYIIKENDKIVVISISGTSIITNKIIDQINVLNKEFTLITTNKIKKYNHCKLIHLPNPNNLNLTNIKLYSADVIFYIFLDILHQNLLNQ